MVRPYYFPDKAKAWQLSNLMANLTCATQTEDFLFTILESEIDSGGVLMLEVDQVYNTFIKEDFMQNIDTMSTLLNGALKEGEGQEMVNYIRSGKITMGGLIPSNLEWQSREDLITKGFYVKSDTL
jgi:hypothetical protein